MAINSKFAVIGSITLLLALRSSVCSTAAPPIASSEAQQPATEYQMWVERLARPTLERRSTDGASSQLKMVITEVTGEERQEVEDQPEFLGSGIVIAGIEVTNDGNVHRFLHSDFGTKGSSGGDPIREADRKRLDELLAELPDDGSLLPPAGRRMIVQAIVGDHSVVRVYDRANASDVVWEIVRLSRSGITSWLPEFQPQSEIDVAGHNHGGLLRLSPDGTQILFASANGPLQFWEPTTHEFLAEIRSPGIRWEDVAFSPDGTLAAAVGSDCSVMNAKTWQVIRRLVAPSEKRVTYSFTNPQFIEDGRYLLLQSSEPALWIFDANTWERVDRLPVIPENAIQYVPAPTGNLALTRTREGVLSLWNVTQPDEITRLDQGGPISHVAFAPDESFIAVATIEGQNGDVSRIRIWKTSTGELVQQLRPYEHPVPYEVEGLAWSPDGRYVLAVTRANSAWTSRNINVFSVGSGRHRGGFIGCPTNVNGIALLPELGQLVAGCNDGKLRFWDLDQGLKQISDFESSLTAHLAPADESRPVTGTR